MCVVSREGQLKAADPAMCWGVCALQWELQDVELTADAGQ